jgi:hypothetical protein
MAVTTKKEALETLITLPNRIKESKGNIFQKKKVFSIKVLSELQAYSNTTQDPASFLEDGRISRFIFKGRITDPNMAHEKYLDDPCDPAIVGTNAARILESLHTNIVVNKDDFNANVGIGDIIFGELEPGDNNKIYDLQFVNLKRVRDIFFGNNGEEKVERCQKLSSLRSKELVLMIDLQREPPPLVDPGPLDVIRGNITNPNNIQLIYWYSGVPAATFGENYVTGIITSGRIGDNKVVIVGESNTNYQSLESEATTAFEANEWGPPSSTILGGWSGGGEGAGAHLQARGASFFDRIILADPFPYWQLTTATFDSSTEMLYNIDNWDEEEYENIESQFETLANSITNAGGSVMVVPTVAGSTSHFQILEEALDATIR